jgi:hypothetical protein
MLCKELINARVFILGRTDMNLTKRHNDMLRAALSYAYSNVDDLNDAFAHFIDDDPDNESGLVDLGDGNVTESFTETEIADLAKMFGFNLMGPSRPGGQGGRGPLP